jgi:hypothetical protein
MQERERRPGDRGDVHGPTRGDFTDWDNPEDAQTGGRPAEIEDDPKGYDEELDEEYELGPNDPDYDLSEGAGYSGWEGRGQRNLLPYWVLVAVSLLLIFALLLPALLRLN